MSLFLLPLTCADPAPIMDANWQNTLMDRFFSDIPTKNLSKQSGGSFIKNCSNNYCNGFWTHIQCDGRRITRLHFAQLRVGKFRLHELPPTLELLWIYDCDQSGTLHTRNLPRALVALSLEQNRLCGRLDLTTLPQNLVKAHFYGNRFTGPISLCQLPQNLQYLQLTGNPIAQEVVWYDNLPPGIAQIWLKKSRQQKIGRVCALHPGKAVDPKIFPAMQPSAIE